MNDLLPLFLIVLLANAVEACAGFGATILSLIFGARYAPIEELIPVLVPLNLVLSFWTVARYHRDIDWNLLLKRILPLAALGMPIGIAIFQRAPSGWLKFGFGTVVAVLATFELLSSKKNDRPLSESKGAFFLVMGGIMQGLYASGGPFVVYYASRAIRNKSKFRTTLALLWLILNLVLAITLIQDGKIGTPSLEKSALLFPAVALGMILGFQLHHRISEERFKKWVYVLLWIAGVSLAYRAFIEL